MGACQTCLLGSFTESQRHLPARISRRVPSGARRLHCCVGKLGRSRCAHNAELAGSNPATATTTKVPDMDSPCVFCGAYRHDPLLARRGRRGRPYQRAVKALRAHGAHICWICRGQIDMALPVNDKWSWTLDHYHPLATYPCLGLEASNHREAHRTCNSSKGDSTPYTYSTSNSSVTRDW